MEYFYTQTFEIEKQTMIPISLSLPPPLSPLPLSLPFSLPSPSLSPSPLPPLSFPPHQVVQLLLRGKEGTAIDPR